MGQQQKMLRDKNGVGILFMVQPDYGCGHRKSHHAFWQGLMRRDSPYQGRVYQDQIASSFDAGNVLLSTALNAQEDFERGQGPLDVTHLGMLHNDVVPEFGWLDILMEELLRTGADMMSVLLPIKDPLGTVSTAVDSDDPYEVYRRLTMTECHERLPETFSAEDVCEAGLAPPVLAGNPPPALLANTGCFIVDFTKPWRKALAADGSILLTMTATDRIVRNRGGKWEAQHSPSDWGFSRTIARLGGKVMVTRKVKALHMGDMPYSNHQAWGEWAYDKALSHHWLPAGQAGDAAAGSAEVKLQGATP